METAAHDHACDRRLVYGRDGRWDESTAYRIAAIRANPVLGSTEARESIVRWLHPLPVSRA